METFLFPFMYSHLPFNSLEIYLNNVLYTKKSKPRHLPPNNLGGNGNGSGFNMAAMMASMAVGGAVGQNIAGTMNNMMGGINQSTQSNITPPPIPKI